MDNEQFSSVRMLTIQKKKKKKRSWRAFYTWFQDIPVFRPNGTGIPDFGVCYINRKNDGEVEQCCILLRSKPETNLSRITAAGLCELYLVPAMFV